MKSTRLLLSTLSALAVSPLLPPPSTSLLPTLASPQAALHGTALPLPHASRPQLDSSRSASTFANAAASFHSELIANVDRITPAARDKSPRADGKELYGVYCVNCHGIAGKGDGIAASSLNPRPRPFKESLKGMSDAQIKEVIATGKGQMPGWGNVLNDDQQKSIVDYIKDLARN